MSDETVGMNMRVPKSVREKANADAENRGQKLKDYIIDLIENGPGDARPNGESDLVKLLTKPRTSDRFGDETIIEEILRRMISVQLIASHNMVQAIGLEGTKKVMDGLDAQADTVVQQRQ